MTTRPRNNNGLSARQQRFIAEFLVDWNATQAAIRAGYAKRHAGVIGSRLLTNVKVTAELTKRKSAQLERLDRDAARVLEELFRVALADPRKYYDAAGNLKAIVALGDDEAAALAGEETLKRNLTAGDGVTDTVHKIRRWDKLKALEILAKHFGMLVDRVQVTGELSVVSERLQAARKRLAARKAP